MTLCCLQVLCLTTSTMGFVFSNLYANIGSTTMFTCFLLDWDTPPIITLSIKLKCWKAVTSLLIVYIKRSRLSSMSTLLYLWKAVSSCWCILISRALHSDVIGSHKYWPQPSTYCSQLCDNIRNTSFNHKTGYIILESCLQVVYVGKKAETNIE